MTMTGPPLFSQSDVDAIAKALASGSEGEALTGSEIGHLLAFCRMAEFDPGNGVTKWKRLQAAFVRKQNARGERTAILEFIRQAMKPALHLDNQSRHEVMRFRLNRALVLAGLQCDEDGALGPAEQATTIREAEARARDLRAGLERRNVHKQVLRFCSAEWLADDYFHAVQEAVKSVMDRLRTMTGATADGADLVNPALGGETPILAINPRRTKSERDEQRGFMTLILGCYGMFRNPTSHEARIHWPMSLQDAEDLMSTVSLIHRRLDNARKMEPDQ
jgi:uncharacterized protein (TIGR02391 family)